MPDSTALQLQRPRQKACRTRRTQGRERGVVARVGHGKGALRPARRASSVTSDDVFTSGSDCNSNIYSRRLVWAGGKKRGGGGPVYILWESPGRMTAYPESRCVRPVRHAPGEWPARSRSRSLAASGSRARVRPF